MKKPKIIYPLLLILTLIIITIYSIWFFAIPDKTIKDFVESSLNQNQIKTSVEGLRKGLFFSINIKSLSLKTSTKSEYIRITNISSRINPLYLLKKQLAFFMKGKIGTGDINGSFKLSEEGNIEITNVELGAIPYISSIGIKGDGLLSGSISFKNNNADVKFKIPDANFEGSIAPIPIPLSLFHTIQGAFSIKGKIIEISSITLEGEKLYARLSGNTTIKGKTSHEASDLILEVMPNADYIGTSEFKSLESMLMKYHVSPGHYVIPIEGLLL